MLVSVPPACHAQKRALGFAFLCLNVSVMRAGTSRYHDVHEQNRAGRRRSSITVCRAEGTKSRYEASSHRRGAMRVGGRTPADQQVLRTPRKLKTPRPRGEVTSLKSHSDEREVKLMPLLQFQIASHTPAMQIPKNGS